jgi:outer membrane protein OmpA-like peptidoglycan-associated protein
MDRTLELFIISKEPQQNNNRKILNMKLFNKTNVATILFSASLVTITSCEAVKNSNNQQRGTVIGTTAGAVIGGILGNNIGKGGNTPLGAVLGGVVGGVAGNVIGRNMDKQAKEIKEILPGAEVERVGEGIKVTLKENMVNFAFDSSDLQPLAKSNLDKLAQILINNPDTNINIYGHTDSKGTVQYNQGLSERRAASVKTYLVSKGVVASRMFTMGMGPSEPIATNETEAGRAQNRRVEFAITANESMINNATSNGQN